MTRVLIVDDHRVVRMGLQALLEETDDITVVGTAANGAEACQLAADVDPDVVLMDLNMAVMDGVEATKRILDKNPSISIVVLTSFSDRDRVLAAIDAGAIGYQLKDADTQTLLKGIRDAAAGQAPLDPRIATQLLASRNERNQRPQLTDREEDVLRLVGKGLLNKQIAQRLSISESTVKATSPTSSNASESPTEPKQHYGPNAADPPTTTSQNPTPRCAAHRPADARCST